MNLQTTLITPTRIIALGIIPLALVFYDLIITYIMPAIAQGLHIKDFQDHLEHAIMEKL